MYSEINNMVFLQYCLIQSHDLVTCSQDGNFKTFQDQVLFAYFSDFVNDIPVEINQAHTSIYLQPYLTLGLKEGWYRAGNVDIFEIVFI